jgi:DNA-binding CsgD family transcriptional regulator/predicted negative regulator of RcsB-dependent stress response
VLRGQFDRALGDHEVVLARARASGDRHAEWQALLDLGLHWAEREHERSGQHCRAALDLARAIDDRSLIAHSLNRVANWHLNRDAPAAAIPLHREALTLFQAAEDRVGIAHTLDLLGMTGFLSGDVQMGTRYYEQAIPLLQEIGDRQRLSTCLATLASQAGDLDCFIPAPMTRESAFWIRRGEEAVAVAREIGWPAGEAYALALLCELTAAQGDFGRAVQQAEAARAIAERIGHRIWTIQSHCKLGRVWVELLDARRAAAELEHALVLARLSGSRLWIAVVASVLASLEVSVGQLDRAATVLDGVIRSETPGLSRMQWLAWVALAELEVARGAPERSLAIVDQLAGMELEPRMLHGNPRLVKLRGDALARLGRTGEAERAYLAARASAALLGHRPLGWRVDAALAHLYAAEGRSADAEAAGQRARATIADLAATIPDQAGREHFRARAGALLPTAPPLHRRSAPVTRLTPRELEVLRCLIEGESDREIAAELGISPRTVMRHVTGILNKLGVASRTAAATVAIRQQIV